MNRFYISYLVLPLTLVFGVIIYLGYLGIFPGISHLFGSDRPENLGTVYTQADYAKFVSLAGTVVSAVGQKVPPQSSLSFTGSAKLNQVFSEAEVSARINYSLWKYLPLDNFQARFSDGNRLEISGNLEMERLNGFIKTFAGSDFAKSSLYQVLLVIGIIPNDPPVYLNAVVSVIDNIVFVKTDRLVVGKVNLPPDQFNLDMIFKKSAESIFTHVPGFYVSSVTFAKGVMHFSGTVPAAETIYIN
jgi:hypothetical protein